MNRKVRIYFIFVLTLSLFLSGCGSGLFAKPTPVDPIAILKANGFIEDTNGSTGCAPSSTNCKGYENKDTAINAYLAGSQLVLTLIEAPGFGADISKQMVQLQVLLYALYPSDLVKAIMATENFNTSSLIGGQSGVVGNYSWDVMVLSNPFSPSGNKYVIYIQKK